ncbi:ubiquitin carboxyl-terminal hydrolase 36 [Tribolium castaneum]|uniref:Ubiquitin carboxyl-terminal hydrolase n=1 Tax=Tribolium castaneum TaxID=7070 RepID=D6WGN1_TRICA|nr:PREDICTED: ubiquitin carboxyl-terminal hydrolase 36 [Tribolium castaneum]EFA00157.1 Ubiquitin carboxyl-terminal hydrolase 36-like Protein [Tribolium castaneum]|eukprot:XP_972954.1 PREDICTED: ubiquitin carboxyl-terminal hydrolase 36 [Tribolium castaneum]
MPASTLEPVNAALRSALTKTDDSSLDTQLAGSTKKALLSNIDFEPAGSYQSTVLDKLKSKYIVLKSSETPQPSKPEGDMGADETLKLASYELYPFEAVQLGWSKCDWSVGAGMINMGNTCYLNSTLQALFHVPALVNWLISDKEHTAECQDSGGLCIICAMRKTLQDSQQRNTNTIRPLLIYNKLRLVCRNLIPGRQEDAHEFLRYLVEAMEKSYLSRFKNHSEFDSKVKETTPLNQILGGYLRSAVRCLKCGHVSTTFQHFQDLLLDIRKAQTLDEALEGYFSREKLDDDSYHCQSCQKKVPATKQFSLERAPMVLCIQLKRFSVSNNKITKHIHFRQRLDLTRYARHRPSVPLIYRLVALVTHMGPTVNCGHYTAVAQAPSGNFYQFDDSMVRVISHQAVFNTNAYIMLYELESSPFTKSNNGTNNKIKPPLSPEANTSNNTSKASLNGIGFTSDKVYGPELPPDRVEKKINGVNPTPVTNGNGNHSESSGTSDSEPENPQKSPQKENKPVATPPLPPKKSMPSINNEETAKSPLMQKNRTLSPRNTNSTTPISSTNAEKKGSFQPVTTKLVPYETDDSSCSDESNQSPQDVEYRVSTKAAVGDWKVTSTEPTTQSKSWGEKKQDGTVSELFKMSHSGYSAPVSSWNGTRSQLDKEISNERREDRKRALSDNSDQGKVKHQKLNNSYKSNPGYNPVQEFHNTKNWSQNNGYKPFYSGNRHRRNFHHKSFHKNYRFRQ